MASEGIIVNGPDLVIAGAPKCGTSSLFRWLADHPKVCGSEPKEPFYLMDREHPLRNAGANYHDHGWDRYEDFYGHCSGAEPLVHLEATTHYIYQRTARRALAALDDPPHVMFALRKPSERLYSSYRYTKHNKARLDPDVSFADLVEMIREGEVAEKCAFPNAYVLARDLRYGCYAGYLDEWRAALGRERLSIVLLEHMKQDPKRVVNRVGRAVGLDVSFYDDYDFARKNKTIHVRHPGVHRLAKRGAQWMRDSWLKAVAKRLYRTVQTRAPSAEHSPADRRTFEWLDQYYAPHNERLARQFKLDLSAWNASET